MRTALSLHCMGISVTETPLDRDPPDRDLPGRNMGPKTETQPEGTWGQAARQKVTSYTTPPPPP